MAGPKSQNFESLRLKQNNRGDPKMDWYDKHYLEPIVIVYQSQNKYIKQRMNTIKNLIQPHKGEKIIELGCATGALTHFCSTFGMQALGVDFSKKAIEIAKKTFKGKNVSFLQRDVSDLHGIKDNSFDKAIAADLVEHISQETFEGMCGEVHRVLKKGGGFSIYTPNPIHVVEIIKKHNFLLKQDTTHIDIKDEKRIISTLEKKGFTICENSFAVSSFFPLNLIEKVFCGFPVIKKFFRYRFCIKATRC